MNERERERGERERERERERDVHIDLNSRQSVLVFDVFVNIECKYFSN